MFSKAISLWKLFSLACKCVCNPPYISLSSFPACVRPDPSTFHLPRGKIGAGNVHCANGLRCMLPEYCLCMPGIYRVLMLANRPHTESVLSSPPLPSSLYHLSFLFLPYFVPYSSSPSRFLPSQMTS